MADVSISRQYQEKYQPVFESVFSAFLNRSGSSKVTVKNYLADLRNFFTWVFDRLTESPVTRDLSSPESVVKSVTADMLGEYKRTAILAKTPVATINRRLTSIRMFFLCAVAEGWIIDNPALGLQNIPGAVKTLSDSTIDSVITDYVRAMQQSNTWTPTDADDVKEFLTWYREQLVA